MIRDVLDHAAVYRLWQRPFADRKLRPILQSNDMAAVRRVLDVGCGPGTNTAYFDAAEYVGIDNNEDYIHAARRRHGREFIVADVTRYRVADGERFDFILVNSLLHHLNDAEVRGLLSHLAELLTQDGHVQILDLVLPDEPSLAQRMAQWDRGAYPRPLARWRELFEEVFEAVRFEPYGLGAFGINLWAMIYFKGRLRTP